MVFWVVFNKKNIRLEDDSSSLQCFLFSKFTKTDSPSLQFGVNGFEVSMEKRAKPNPLRFGTKNLPSGKLTARP